MHLAACPVLTPLGVCVCVSSSGGDDYKVADEAEAGGAGDAEARGDAKAGG